MTAASPLAQPLLSVRDLSIKFNTLDGPYHAVQDVSFDILPGEAVGFVGESGSGKSVTALSVMRLLPPNAEVLAGKVTFRDRDIYNTNPRDLRRLRGKDIGLVSQEPTAALNPSMSIGAQIAEPLRKHLGLSKRAAWDRAAELLASMHVPNARGRLGDYPYQMSGGMCQRVMIAIALSCEPALVIADEPTTALDVTTQAQILMLLAEACRDSGAALMLISHDLGVIASMCDRVNVMYAGQVVESGAVDQVLRAPEMPYTKALLDCSPRIDVDEQPRLISIPGNPPNLSMPMEGCHFVARCSFAQAQCGVALPALSSRGDARQARCFGSEENGWIKAEVLQ